MTSELDETPAAIIVETHLARSAASV